LLTGIVGGVGLQALYLTSTYACTCQWSMLGWALAAVGICGVALYFTWYRHLPGAGETGEET
jgi:hypothetical protein